MKLCVKKIYCSGCRRLVRAREQRDNGNTRILCARCGRLLYIWDGISWRYMREAA